MTVIKQYNSGSGLWETILVGGPGAAGPSGSTGSTGATGPTGPTGPPGADAIATGTKVSGLAALTGAAVGDLLEVVDISDTSMAATGTNKKLTLAELKVFLGLPSSVYNASTTSQSAGGFATDTYVTGSSIAIPANRLQAKTIYRCRIYVVKTNAGTAAPVVTLRFGTAGTTADPSIGAISFVAGSANVDGGIFDIEATFNSVGSGTSAVVWSVCQLTHGLSGTGIINSASATNAAVSGGFNSTLGSAIIGVSINGGASAAWTVSNVVAQLTNMV